MDELYRMLGKERDADLEREARTRRRASDVSAQARGGPQADRPRPFDRIGAAHLIEVIVRRRSNRATVPTDS